MDISFAADLNDGRQLSHRPDQGRHPAGGQQTQPILSAWRRSTRSSGKSTPDSAIRNGSMFMFFRSVTYLPCFCHLISLFSENTKTNLDIEQKHKNSKRKHRFDPPRPPATHSHHHPHIRFSIKVDAGLQGRFRNRQGDQNNTDYAIMKTPDDFFAWVHNKVVSKGCVDCKKVNDTHDHRIVGKFSNPPSFMMYRYNQSQQDVSDLIFFNIIWNQNFARACSLFLSALMLQEKLHVMIV
jgi:hypothetical protein